MRQERLSSWGITGKIQRKSPGSKFPASFTSLDASGWLNVTGDVLLVCYFKPWILVEWWFNSGFRVENPTCRSMFVMHRSLHSAVYPSVGVSSSIACLCWCLRQMMLASCLKALWEAELQSVFLTLPFKLSAGVCWILATIQKHAH